MRRRTRRVVAAVLAATAAAAGVVTLIEIVNVAVGGGYLIVDWPGWVAALARNTWSDAGPRLTGAMLAVLGLLLVFLGVWPGPPERFAVTGSSERTATFVTRRGLRRALHHAALAVDGVVGVGVRVRRRRATVRLRVNTRTAADAPTRARSALAGRLDAFHLTRPPKLRVRIRTVRPPRRTDRVVPEAPTALQAGMQAGAQAGAVDGAAHGRDLPHSLERRGGG